MAQFVPEVRHGLDQLLRAVDYARDLDSPLWDFAVEIERLLALDMTTSDLRWLVKRGYLSHAREVTAAQDTDRRFECAEQNLTFAKNTCFVLTEAGLALLGWERFQANPAVVEMPVVAARPHGPLVLTDSLRNAGPAAESQIDLPPREWRASRNRLRFPIGTGIRGHSWLASIWSNASACLRRIKRPCWTHFRKKAGRQRSTIRCRPSPNNSRKTACAIPSNA